MSSASDGCRSDSSESDLHRALAGDERVGETLYNSSFDRLLRLARRRAPWLPRDIQEEIPGETWALIYARGLSVFEAAGTTDEAYLAQVHRNAVEAVTASNRAPRTRSRVQKRRGSTPPQVRAAVGRRPAVKLESDDLDLQPDPKGDVFAEVDRRIDLERRMESMEPQVSEAVKLILLRGFNLTEAAKVVGMTRQTLGRRMQELAA